MKYKEFFSSEWAVTQRNTEVGFKLMFGVICNMLMNCSIFAATTPPPPPPPPPMKKSNSSPWRQQIYDFGRNSKYHAIIGIINVAMHPVHFVPYLIIILLY